MKKKQIKNFLKTGILLFGILFTLSNCEKDDSILSQSLIEIVQKQKNELLSFEKNFSLKNHQDDFIKNNLVINWNKYSVYDGLDSSKIYEFNSNLNAKISSKEENISFYSEFKLQVVVDKNNNISFQIIKYLSTKKSHLKNISLNSLNNFSGTIYYFNLEGIILKIEGYEKGLKANIFVNSSNNKNISAKEAPVGDNGSWVLVYTVRWTDWYQNLLGGNIVFFYTHSAYNGTTSEWVYVTNGGGFNGSVTYHSHFDDPHGPSPSTYIDNHLEEILIDPSFENTKAECVYNKLEELSIGFKNAIKKFDGEFPVAHLIFKMEDIGTSRGQTRAPDGHENSPNYNITIVLNNNSSIHGVNYRPNLMTAKTIAHEVIHAEMYRKLLSLANQGNLDFTGWSAEQQKNYVMSIQGNYPGIYDYYRRHKDWQHEQMASHYRQSIADILKEFDNAQHLDQFYTDIAWEGLIKSTLTAWINLSLQEQDRIKKVISDYINANQDENCQ